MGITTDLIYIVIAAVIGGSLAHLCRQPLIFGYILAGIAVGPYTGGITVKHIHDIEMLAEIGIALLLFTLGLEFSFGELRRLAKITFIGTPIQIVLCSLFGYFAAIGLGLSTADAAWIGSAASLSSTMVVLKTLGARNALNTGAGRIMLAILIAQDVAVVPLMLLLPQLSKDSFDYAMTAAAVGKSVLFLAAMYLGGTRVLPRVFGAIARQGSRELFFLSTLGVAFGAGFASHQLGLSFALGAFVAGMLLSETDYNHQALSDVSGLRDLFALIFFVSVGMLIDPRFFVAHIGLILALTATIVAAKAIITGTLLRVFGYDTSTAIKVGLGLSQVGEFAFVILNFGTKTRNLSTDSFSLMIAVTVVSMIATPGLFWIGSRLTSIIERSRKAGPLTQDDNSTPAQDHVVVIGGGVVGGYVARVLGVLKQPYLVIESDLKAVTVLRDQGIKVLFGDGSQRVILEAARISAAKLIVVTTTNDKLLPLMVSEIRQVRGDVMIVVRAEEVADLEELSSLKVDEIVQPQLEIGLEMVRQSLLALQVEDAKIFALLGQLRTERYHPKESLTSRREIDGRLVRASRMLEFHWVDVSSGSGFDQCTLGNSRLRERYGVSVVAALRGEEFIATPGADFTIASGDLLAVLGTKAQFDELRKVC